MTNPLHIITRIYYKYKYKPIKKYLASDEFKKQLKKIKDSHAE
jgi:hypothetical protein